MILSCSLVLVDVVFIRFAQWTRRRAARASRKLGVFLAAYQGLGIQVWPVGWVSRYGRDPVWWTPRKRECSLWDTSVGSSLLSSKTRP